MKENYYRVQCPLGQVGLSYVRKVSEHSRRNEPVRSILPWFYCSSFLELLPWFLCDKLFPGSIKWNQTFYSPRKTCSSQVSFRPARTAISQTFPFVLISQSPQVWRQAPTNRIRQLSPTSRIKGEKNILPMYAW